MKRHLRIWWQKPRKIGETDEDRSVSFLELFYDLSYVVIVAEITHSLVAHLSFKGFWQFAALFAMVWWAWVNGAYYHELHSNNDVRTRVFTFLQMFALAGMAIFAHNAWGDGYQGFAISYAAFLAIITFMWWRTGIHDPAHKPMSLPYTRGFVLTTLIFIISAFVEPPLTYYLWIAGIAVSLILPLIFLHNVRRTEKNHDHVEETQQIRHSLVERFGLLTIIMLGEIVVAVVAGVAGHHHIDVHLIVTAALGLLIGISLWWLYFDFVSRRLPIQKDKYRYTWFYTHLPITMSITAIGAGVLTVIEHGTGVLADSQRWLIIAPVVVFLLSVALLMQVIQVRKENEEMYKQGTHVALLSAIAILIVGFLKLETIWVLVLINLFLLAPVFRAIKLWIRRIHIQEGHKHNE